MSNDTAPTAIVCWAHDDVRWQETISDFVFKLRSPGGVDADVDLFHIADSTVLWSNFGADAITSKDFVLLAVSAGFRRSWEGKHDPQVSGAGAAREADIVRGLLQEEPHFKHRLKIVVLPGATKEDIPRDLLGSTRFEIPRELGSLLQTIRGERTALPSVSVVPAQHTRAVNADNGQPSPEQDDGDDERSVSRIEFKQAARDALAIQASPATEYLYAELDHSVGAYRTASSRLVLVEGALPSSTHSYRPPSPR